MVALGFLAIVTLCLFLVAFFTKRRFGVLGLSLAAGALLSANWTGTLTPFIEQQGVVVSVPPLEVIVAASLILAPAFLLLFSGPTYEAGWARALGSLCFTLLALAFLLAPLGDVLRLDGQSKVIFDTLVTSQSVIIVAGLIAAIIDIFLTRNPKRH